mmetsp:Transcript_22504/g.32863  ORF Transcript_22504/g.32863 Transcript_22504/m.32863 type:complete len:1089 (-) Transcript_22504:216-3482(-)
MINLCVFVVVVSVWLSVYLKGFLLTKTEVLDINVPDDTEEALYHMEPRFNRVVLIVIDALRLDYMTYVEPDESGHVLPSHNKLTAIHSLVLNNSSQCVMYGFRADPPTTTSQRLKGIATGGLPAFVEIGSNFNSQEVQEDSIVKQWKLANKKVLFMGDDTWEGLFGKYFHKSFPFDSFNTRDLDSVDDGIISHIWKEYENASKLDWDVLIAHFLSVDHVGHTYNAHHPLMGERLSRMNEVIQRVIAGLPDDALLVIMGDHGMTDDGEHGGNSQQETDSGLFLYSKTSFVSDSSTFFQWDPSTRSMLEASSANSLRRPRVVNQVDLTPTISSLTGLPVPFTSLGSVLPEVFYRTPTQVDVLYNKLRKSPDSRDSCEHTCTAALSANPLLYMLFTNAQQVMRYMLVYFASRSNVDRSVSNLLKKNEVCIIICELPLENVCRTNESCHEEVTSFNVAHLHQTEPIGIDGYLTDISSGSREMGVRKLYQLFRTSLILHVEYTCSVISGADPFTSIAYNMSSCIGTYNLGQEAVISSYYSFFDETLRFARLQWTSFGVIEMLLGLIASTFCIAYCVISVLHSIWTLNFFKFEKVRRRGEEDAHAECKPKTVFSTVLRRVVSFYSNLNTALSQCDGMMRVQILFLSVMLIFHSLSSLSNSFIVKERYVYYYEVQTLCLLRCAYHIFLQLKAKNYCHSSTPQSSRALLSSCGPDIVALATLRLMSYVPPDSFIEPNAFVALRSVFPSVVVISIFCGFEWYVAGRLGRYVPLYRLVSVLFAVGSSVCLAIYIFTSNSCPRVGLVGETSALLQYICVDNGENSLRNISAVVVLSCCACGVGIVSLQKIRKDICGRFRNETISASCCDAVHISLHMSTVIMLVSLDTFLVSALVAGLCVVSVCASRSIATIVLLSHPTLKSDLRDGYGPRVLQCTLLLCGWSFQCFCLGRLAFFLSGHEFDFGKVQVAAGFTGTESFDFVYSGAMVSLNTFGYDILCFVLCIAVCHAVLSDIYRYLSIGKVPMISASLMHEETRRTCVTIVWSQLLYRMCILCGSMLSAFLLRRHLMMWAVFAPKTIFESAFWYANLFGTILVMFVML